MITNIEELEFAEETELEEIEELKLLVVEEEVIELVLNCNNKRY